MRSFVLSVATLVFVLSITAVAQTADIAAARAPLENYIKGHATVDVEFTKKAFHTQGDLIFIRDGKYATQSFTDYIASLVGRKPAVDEAKRKRSIESIDVSGNAGIAKVVSDYPTVKYVDYMALLKIGDEWKIVNKIYFAESKPGSGPTVSDRELARIPLENYLKGHATGDGEYMRKAFHTDGNLIFIRDGKFTTRSFADYIAGFSGKPAADEAQRKRSIEAVDVSGNAASAKIILDYPATRFVDYMSLLKIDGEWKIVSKIFYAEPKAKPTTNKAAQ